MLSAIHQHESTTGIPMSPPSFFFFCLVAIFRDLNDLSVCKARNMAFLLPAFSKFLQKHIQVSRFFGWLVPSLLRASQLVLVVKNLPANTGDGKRCGFNPCIGKISGEEHDNPLHYFLTREFHGRGAWWSMSIGLQRVEHNWTQLKWLSTHTPS